MIGQSWDPARYAQNARFVSELGLPVVDLLAPQPGERILDLGCGDGALTEKLVACGCSVVGVDASSAQVEAARGRGLDARVMSGEALQFECEFDAVFSNAALHWMKKPDAVLAGVHRALRPDGRFVGEFGGAGNVAAIDAALTEALARRGIDAAAISPWYFPSPDEYARKLQAHGFDVRSVELIPRPTPLPGRMVDWLNTFAEPFANALPPGERSGLFEEVEQALCPTLCDSRGHWTADYVRLRFAAARR